VTCHDGFTLADLVSYNHKHNDANGEGNSDGSDDNRSWNCGAEGPTDAPAVLALRARQQRNFLATLLLSQGVPMLLGGDELGRTQDGNNNAYCQDNELSWVHWPAEPSVATDTASKTSDKLGTGPSLDSFVRTLIRLRAEHPVFRRRRFFTGEAGRTRPDHLSDIRWLTPAADEMTDDDWAAGFAKSLTVFLNGDAIAEPDPRGQRITDESFLLMFNAAEHGVDFIVPAAEFGEQWLSEIDTADPHPPPGGAAVVKPGDRLTLDSLSLRLLRRV
jgi:isoamylase